MLNTAPKPHKRVQTKKSTQGVASPKRIAVIKNSLTATEMDEAGQAFLNHKGAFMTVAESLAYAAEQAKRQSTLSD